MKDTLFIVKKIYASRMTDDRRSMYMPIIFYIPGKEEEEFVLHLRSDKNINHLNFQEGDIWTNFKLAAKSRKSNTIQLEGIEREQRVGSIHSWSLIASDTEIKTFVYQKRSSEIKVCIVQLGTSQFYSVTELGHKLPYLYRLTKQQIFKQFQIIIA